MNTDSVRPGKSAKSSDPSNCYPTHSDSGTTCIDTNYLIQQTSPHFDLKIYITKLQTLYAFLYVFYLPAAPSGPPQNFQGRAVSSRSITLTWEPPLFAEQNGVITGYTIHVMLNQTEETFELFSGVQSINADLFRPFRNYIFEIAGQTTVGVGTFSDPITIMTPEDGRNTLAS